MSLSSTASKRPMSGAMQQGSICRNDTREAASVDTGHVILTEVKLLPDTLMSLHAAHAHWCLFSTLLRVETQPDTKELKWRARVVAAVEIGSLFGVREMCTCLLYKRSKHASSRSHNLRDG